MKLYDFALSGHAHRAHLFLSLLGVDAEIIDVDLKNLQQKSPEYLKMNPFGQVPVLVDGDVAISDSTAILVYLAKKYGDESWLPTDPVGAARIQRWLSVASGEIAYGVCAARLVTVFKRPFNPVEVIERAHRILTVINDQLANSDWIAGDHRTIADVALYSYVARCPEGNVDRFRYENVTKWLKRVEALPGFFPFPKSPVGIPDPD